MSAKRYKEVKAEVLGYVQRGEPLKAGRIHEQYEAELSFKQYYELVDIVFRALDRANG